MGARPWADASRELLELAAEREVRAEGTLVREGRVWRFGWGGREVGVPDAKGVRDLAILLARPGTDVHAGELYAAGSRTVRSATSDRGDAAVDAAAREAYRARLARLDDELAAAESGPDLARAQRLTRERDALIAELRRAFDARDRPRRLGDGSERARKAVSARIRDAVAVVEQGHPGLGVHLRDAVRTGTYCGYHPTPSTRWRVRQI